jgi:hypothetical protein
MRVHEGRGFLLRTGCDGPFAGWLSLRRLDALVSVREAPWMALQSLALAARAFPGGLALLWDVPFAWLEGMTPELRRTYFLTLAQMPGLELHLKDDGFMEWLGGPIPAWFHSPEAPLGPLGHAWRQGWIGWIPEQGAAWSLPGFGTAAPENPEDEMMAPGSLWGELVLPVGALGEIGVEEVAGLIADAQARLEWDFSLRLSARAWPEAFPFQRRKAGWRVALLGGREFELGSGGWESAALQVSEFLQGLGEALRCPIWAGSCHDPILASQLGHQAMREGLPWRATLPMPPASPVFSPGLGTDPRELASLEARSAFPAPLADILAHPPQAWLRVPNAPQEGAVTTFLRGRLPVPAIRWLPPEVPPPGPFTSERPWPQASAFVPLLDVTQALQMRLFDEDDLD